MYTHLLILTIKLIITIHPVCSSDTTYVRDYRLRAPPFFTHRRMLHPLPGRGSWNACQIICTSTTNNNTATTTTNNDNNSDDNNDNNNTNTNTNTNDHSNNNNNNNSNNNNNNNNNNKPITTTDIT